MKNLIKKITSHKDIIKRIYSFFIIKVGLVFTRWSLIFISYYKLDSTDFALLASAYSLIEILRIVSEFGTEGFIYSRLIRKESVSKIIYSLIELRLLLAIFLSIVFIGISSYKYNFNEVIIFLLLPLLSIESSSFVFLQKQNRIKELTKVSVASLFTLILIFIYLHKRSADIGIMAILFLIPDLIITIMCLFFTKKNWALCSTNFISVLKKNKKIMGYIIPSGLVGIIFICYSRLDLVLVLPILGQKVQAVYSYAFRFVEPFSILTSLFTISFITEIGIRSKEKFTKNYIRLLEATKSRRNIIIGIIISLFISTFLALFADLIMHFHKRILIFVLSMPIVLRFINNMMISYFFRTSQYFDLLKIIIVNFIIILVSGAILARYIGLTGIAFASVLGELYMYYRQKKYISKKLILE
jgi:O-antigen/teichoic acid export membrane protein